MADHGASLWKPRLVFLGFALTIVATLWLVYSTPVLRDQPRIGRELDAAMAAVVDALRDKGQFSAPVSVDKVHALMRTRRFAAHQPGRETELLAAALTAQGWVEMQSKRSWRLFRKGEYFASIEERGPQGVHVSVSRYALEP